MRKMANRRAFLKNTGSLLIGGAVAHHFGVARPVGGRTNEPTIKVGLVGCGGRGTGAAIQAIKADPNVVLTAMGDIFDDRLEQAYTALTAVVPDKLKIGKRDRFIGFDAYQKVIDSDVDVVLLATPPAFRPGHLAAAVAAGKHTFCEKPVAIDAPGVRSVLASARLAKEKKLGLLSGFCFRHDYANQATFQQVLDGAIGEVRTVTTFRCGGELPSEYTYAGYKGIANQLRNWYYQNWLSGDFIVEQAVHSIDMMSWAMGGILPVKVIGTGGRQRRVDEKFGNIYDHFAIEYQYENGARGIHFCRQQAGTTSRNTVDISGTLGDAHMIMGREHVITGSRPWQYTGEMNNMFQTEHDEFFASIRQGNPINDGEWMANSTLLAIMGRMAGYSGQEITWEAAFDSEQALGPRLEDYHWNLEWASAPVAVPGITKVL